MTCCKPACLVERIADKSSARRSVQIACEEKLRLLLWTFIYAVSMQHATFKSLPLGQLVSSELGTIEKIDGL